MAELKLDHRLAVLPASVGSLARRHPSARWPAGVRRVDRVAANPSRRHCTIATADHWGRHYCIVIIVIVMDGASPRQLQDPTRSHELHLEALFTTVFR